jgi:uncharacterized protein (DUF1330 family)
MAAFLIVEISKVHDEITYSEYRQRVPSNLAAAGAQYLVRGGAVEVLEGSWRPNRVVAIRFESAEAALRWWNDPRYCELKAMRQRSTTTNMILVEGLPHA